MNSKKVPLENTRFSTYPGPGAGAKFAVAFGGGAGYVPKWEYMWDTIGKQKPAALLMLGDNVYIDQPELTLCQDYCYHRRQARPEWRRLVAATPTYAIYDDHDFGKNDCVPGPEIDEPAWKRRVWNIFRRNWANPSYGGGEEQPRVLVRLPHRRRAFHPARRALLPRPERRQHARAGAEGVAEKDTQGVEGHLQGSGLARTLGGERSSRVAATRGTGSPTSARRSSPSSRWRRSPACSSSQPIATARTCAPPSARTATRSTSSKAPS